MIEIKVLAYLKIWNAVVNPQRTTSINPLCARNEEVHVSILTKV